MKRLRRATIRGRLVLALLGTALLALAIAGATLVLYERLTLERRAQRVLEPYTHLVAVGVEAAVAFEDTGRATEILNTLRSNPQILEAQIILADGRLLARYNSRADTPFRPPPLAPEEIFLTGATAESWLSLSDGAHLRLVMGLDELRRQTREALLLFAAGVVLLLVAVTLVLLVTLQRTIVRPIAALAGTVEQVGARADYQRRVPAAGTDEVARLGQSFNAMLAAIDERQNALRQLNVFQRTILDNAAYGIITTTPDGTITSFNPAAERLLGYTAGEVIGKASPSIWHLPQEIAEHARRFSGEYDESSMSGFDVLAAAARRGLTDEHEWTFVRKDGSRVPVLLSVTALRNEHGGITGFLGLTYDLTERKRTEQELFSTNETLVKTLSDLRATQLQVIQSEKLVALGTLAAGVAHELNNPLMGIMGYVTFAREVTQEPEARQLLERANRELTRMRDLIKNMLGFARPVSSGRLTALNIQAELERTLALMHPEFKMRDVTVATDLQPDLPPVLAQADHLQQVLLNLLMNARDAVEGRPRREIHITVRRTDTQATIAIRDTGPGIPPELQTRIFDPFFTTKPPGKGTGLGLSIARNALSALGGSLTCDSPPGDGATFTVTLPLLPPVNPEARE